MKKFFKDVVDWIKAIGMLLVAVLALLIILGLLFAGPILKCAVGVKILGM